MGIIVCFLFGYGIFKIDNPSTMDIYWRIMFGFPIVLCLLRMFCLTFIYNYDTPDCLIKKNKEMEARAVIEKLYLPEAVEEVYNKKKTKSFTIK